MFDTWGIRGCLLAAIAVAAGCTICDNCDDQAYSGYGGRWQRTDRSHGRVGSIFTPAGAPIGNMPPGAEIIESEAPILDSVPWDNSGTWDDTVPSSPPPNAMNSSVIELDAPVIEAY
jgi:hypothetical protein